MAVAHKAKYILIKDKIAENSSLFVDKGRFTDRLADCEVIDHGRALITPGFINFHTHLQYTDLEKSNKKNFPDWIISLIQQYSTWDTQKKINSLQNGLDETVKSGVTLAVNLGMEEEFIEVFEDAGIKSYVFLETFADTEERSNREFKRLMKCLEKYNTSNLGISPHSPYNVHPLLWQKLVGTGVLLHTHLAESADEAEWLRGLPSGIDKLHEFVGFKPFKPHKVRAFDNLIAAHLCQLDFDEARHYNIAHCPRSNLFLHGKTLEITGNTGRIGLGTDSRFSNHDLNILHEARFLRDRGNAGFMEIMKILTVNPARMLGLEGVTGSIEPGGDADFLVFKLKDNELPESILDRDGPDSIYARGVCLKNFN